MLIIPALAEAQNDEKTETLVLAAQKTFNNFRADPDMGWFRNNVKTAKGVFIVPSLLKAGFIFGGSGGNGVLLAHDENTGQWSYPAFFTMGAGSFGFQAGVEKAEVILMVLTQKGMDSMLSTSFKLGADVTVAAGPVGAGAKFQMVDILAFSRSKGIYGGISLEGAVITPRDARNEAYYGKPCRSVDILIRHSVTNPQADPLRAVVAHTTGK
ncbi:lipid-binding SYLF domain-containing protein [Desulfonema ishimotonii]|nr:lipid-binding SYLF domain-containing protein [Desulfonema ishimotonii]